MKIKFLILIIGFTSLQNSSLAQFELIETFTDATINEIDFYNNKITLIGYENYISRCTGNCDDLILKNIPDMSANANYSFNRIDSNLAFVLTSFPGSNGGTNAVYKTTDNAETWGLVFDTTYLTSTSLVMFDSLEGLINNYFYSNLRTLDGGLKWTAEPFINLSLMTWAKFDDSVFCVGDVEDFAISFDRGNTWQYGIINEEVSQNDIDFISKDTIISCAYGNGAGVFFSKSIDSGLNWQFNMLGGYIFPTKVRHLSNETIYIVGSISLFDDLGIETLHGAIMKSIDFGETWSTYDTEILTSFLDIEFINDSIALISGTNGVLIRYFYRDHHLGFEEQSLSKSNFNIFPNPSNSEIKIQYDFSQFEYKTVILEIQDLSGKIIQTQNLDSNSQSNTIEISKLENGVYFAEIIVDGKSIATEKFVVEK